MQESYFDLFHSKRMRAPARFPGRTVIQTFIATEAILEEVLAVVPFCEEHGAVWSPRLTTVLLEAGSQIDSLWRFEAEEERIPKRVRNGREIEWNIEDVFACFGSELAMKWIVFFGSQHPMRIAPFANWQSRTDYKPIDWWKAYTALKHDRLGNHSRATLAAAVDAMAGLFLAIARCGYCDEYMLEANWVTCSTFGHDDDVKLDEFPPQNYAVIETRLFAYPLGLWQGTANVCPDWHDRNASYRFRLWFPDYHAEQRAIELAEAHQAVPPMKTT